MLPESELSGNLLRVVQKIGVGKGTLPALRTVRAVLPHTALQNAPYDK